MAERPVPEEFLARFREEAESDGFLTFEQFQELALYAPRYGYSPGRVPRSAEKGTSTPPRT